VDVKSLFEKSYADFLPESLFKNVIYPKDTLKDLGKSHILFQKLDTHMSEAGAYCVANIILHRLGYDYALSDYFSPFETLLPGELSTMLGREDRHLETQYQPNEDSIVRVDNLKDLRGNTNNICILFNPKAKTNLRLLVIGDSFMKYSLIYLSPVFRDIVYARSEFFQEDLVDLYCPDMIITSNVERYLSDVRPDGTGSSVLLSGYGKPDYKPPEEFAEALRAQLSYRYHRTSYTNWMVKYCGDLRFGILGHGTLNDQIAVQDLVDWSFSAIGVDPHFTFTNVVLDPLKRYELHVDMVSDVASTAQLFYSCAQNPQPDFSETRSEKIPLTLGLNKLRFDLNHPTRGTSYRFDPLAHIGSFRIEAADVVEIP
jgi:hypothetical protein